jgi:phenylacetate-CoA ligase
VSDLATPGLRRSDLEGTLWPPVSLGGNAVLAALIAQFETTERLDWPVIEAMQARQLAVISAHHRAHTPSFAARLKAAGLGGRGLDSLERLRALPPIGRRDIQSAGAEFFSNHVPQTHLPVSELKTSGSTGEPVTLRKTQIHSLLWSAINVRDYQWNRTDFTGRISIIRPQIKAYYERQGWGHPVETLYASGASQGIPMATDIAKQLSLIRRFRPQTLVAFPSNLAAFADTWAADGFEPSSLRHLKTVGETVSDTLRERVKAVTGLAIEDHYSSQEAGPIALECPVSGLYHLMSEALVVEVLNARGEACAEGESGKVVLTDLHNLATPLIRYECGDVAEVGGSCPCGRTLPTLARILGRETNLVMLPDGTRHRPRAGWQRFEQVAPIRQFQLIQHTLTAIELRVVADRDGTAEQNAALSAIVRDSLGHPFDVEVVWFRDRLPLGPGGKLEQFVCKVAPAAA